MVRKARRSGGRGCPLTYPGQQTPSSSSTSHSHNGIGHAAGPHLRCLREVASSITGAANTLLSPCAFALLVGSAPAARRLPMVQLRRAAAAVEKLYALVYGPPTTACHNDRKILLQLIFGQQDNRVAFLQLLALAAGALEDTDRGLCTEDQGRCARLFAHTAIFVHTVLTTAEEHPKLTRVVVSELLRLNLLTAHASLLIAARNTERQQTLSWLQDWFRPTIILVENLMHSVLLLCESLDQGQAATVGGVMSSAATGPPASSSALQHRLALAVKIAESMSEHHYVEQIVRTTLSIVLLPDSRAMPKSRCYADAIITLKHVYDKADELLGIFQKLQVQTEASIRIATALRTLLCGPNAHYLAAISTVTRLSRIGVLSEKLYGMNPSHATALKSVNPHFKEYIPPSRQQDELDWVGALQWSTTFWMMCLNNDLPLRLCKHGPECRFSRDVLRELALRLMHFVRRRGVERYTFVLEQQQQTQPESAVVGTPAAVESAQVLSLANINWEEIGANEHCGLDDQWRFIARTAMLIAFRCSRREVVWSSEPTSRWDNSRIETNQATATQVWRAVVPIAHGMLTESCNPFSDWVYVAVPFWSEGDLPPEPPPNLAGALSTGFVPLLERSLRSRANTLVAELHELFHVFSNWSRFGRILAYGERRQVEALLVTRAKLIRRLGAEGTEAAPGGGGDGDGTAGHSTTERLKVIAELKLLDMLSWMACYAAVQYWYVSGGGAGAGTAAAAADCEVLSMPREAFSALELKLSWVTDVNCNASTRQASGVSPSADACSSTGRAGESDEVDKGSCRVADNERNSEQELTGGRLTSPQGGSSSGGSGSGSGSSGSGGSGSSGSGGSGSSGSGGSGSSGSGGSGSSGSGSDVLHWAKGPAHQLSGLVVRAAQLWLPAAKCSVTQLSAGAGRADVLQGLYRILECVVPLTGAHALAADRLALPDWWSLYGGAVDEEQLHAAEVFWRRLLLEELGVVELTGRMLKLLAQQAVDDVSSVLSSSMRGMCLNTCRAISALASEFPVEVAAGLRNDILPRDCLLEICGLKRAGRLGEGDVQTWRFLEQRIAVLGGLSPAEAATAHLPFPSCFCDDVGLACGLREISTMLLLGSLKSIDAAAAGYQHTCAHPACTNLAGDSEATLPLPKKCGKCGQVSYCSGACQWAHWTSGHKEQCDGVQQRAQQGAG